MNIPQTERDFDFLFSDTSGRYILIQVDDVHCFDPTKCVVYDKIDKRGLLIEDDELHSLVNSKLYNIKKSYSVSIP